MDFIVFIHKPATAEYYVQVNNAMVRHNFQKYPGPKFAQEIYIFLITKRDMQKIRLKSILHTFKIYLKIVHFLGTVLL